MPCPSEPTFVFCTCQPGAEQLLKGEVASRRPDWRLAFSRPGFVSFKCEQSIGAALDGALPTFARTRSISLGRITSESLAEASVEVWQLPELIKLLEAQKTVALHVWQRDTQMPGEDGVEPVVTPLALEAKQALLAAAADAPGDTNLVDRLAMLEATVAPTGAVVLDVAMVEPNEWYIGWHRATSRAERWPGGMLSIAGPENMISRAYLKIEEALKWSALPATRGDIWVELGCAPGGASQALLDRGFQVIGVDPAEVEEPVASHPRFSHHRKRSAEVRRVEFAQAKWLAADLNATPQYTLDAAEDVVSHPSTSLRGLVLTLKVTNTDLASPQKLAEYIKRVRSWGFRDVRLRQLVHNRHELCLVALHSRSQRRMKRGRKRPTEREVPSEPKSTTDEQPVRFDAPTRMVPPHHFR